MNRKQRRQAKVLNKPASATSAAALAPITPPGLLLRVFAKVVLSPWVLNRVQHPDVEHALAGIADQVGKPEIARNLRNRIAMRG
jgi:hypothetical protein